MLRDEAISEILVEYRRATLKHGAMHSPHEGYAVLLEELDELWEEIKTQNRAPSRIQREAIHVAAMALRFLVDVC
jgi:hypothetical protein